MTGRFSTAAIAGLLALPAMAGAGSSSDASSIESLERRMQEMSNMFNSQINALKEEIAELKSRNQQMSNELSSAAAAPVAAPVEAKPVGPRSWTDSFKIGGKVRLRGYYLNSVWDLDDDSDTDRWDVFAHKTSLWLQVDPSEKVSGYVKISNQNFGEGVTAADKWEIDHLSNKIFVDNAYIDVKEMFDLPVDVRIGRQDLMCGTGFVLYDGNSQFGSTSYFLDGIKLGWKISDNILLDGLYFKDWEGQRDNAADDDITLGGGYLTVKACPLTGAREELYVLNRNDENLTKDIWMYGLRISDKFDWGLDYSLEGAIQQGDAYRDTVTDKLVDHEALGYKLGAGYTFRNREMKPRIYLGYTFLSGDEDAGDDDNERWDVFYGGWPQFGDIIAWKYRNTGPNVIRVSYDPTYNQLSSTTSEAVFANFALATLGVSADFFKNFSASLSYSLMTADETAAGYDDDIGDVYQLTMKYQYTAKLSFSLYGGIFDPGDAFDNPATAIKEADDAAREVFLEADYNF